MSVPGHDALSADFGDGTATRLPSGRLDFREGQVSRQTFEITITDTTKIPQVGTVTETATPGTYTATLTHTVEEEITVTAGVVTPDGKVEGTVKVTFVDPPPAVTASITGPASGSVDEDAGTAEYTVSLDGSPSAAVDVTWAVTNGGTAADATATTAADFGDGTATTLPTGTLSFASGATGAALTRTFTVPINDDTTNEPDTETFTVTLTTGAAAGVLTIDATAGSVETTITDDDLAGVRVSAPDPATVAEATAGDVFFTVTLDAPAPSGGLRVEYDYGDNRLPRVALGCDHGDARATTDYTHPASTLLQFAEGETVKRVRIPHDGGWRVGAVFRAGRHPGTGRRHRTG